MSKNSRFTIADSLIIMEPDYSGATVAVLVDPKRPKFDSLVIDDTGVRLIDAHGDEHWLEGASIVDARLAAEMGVMLAREVDIDDPSDVINEYAIRVECALEHEDDAQMGMTP